jgi:hypothetical protein
LVDRIERETLEAYGVIGKRAVVGMNENEDDRHKCEILDTGKQIEGGMKSIDDKSGTPRVLL